MGESVARSSTISAASAAKPRASKRSAKAEQVSTGRTARRVKRASPSFEQPYVSSLFTELARIAEMSAIERELRACGFRAIAGTDEVGRGCLAGPVVAAAVVLDGDASVLRVHDSKQLLPEHRRALCYWIMRRARSFAVGVIDSETIDRINILAASKLAMREAVESLSVRPDILVLDAVYVENLIVPQIPLIEGDRRSVSVAAASIVAKVYRDQLMESYHELYPEYDFINNRGYGTENHLKALATYGPSPIHRRGFLSIKEASLFD